MTWWRRRTARFAVSVLAEMSPPVITRRHLTRLRQIHRSSGWPCKDMLEVDLQVAGLIDKQLDDQGRETLFLTPTGLTALSQAHANNRASRTAHDDLVMCVAAQMQMEGRIAWTGMALRAQVNGAWVQAIPDVFSIRNTTVEAYLEPVVHEIKVSRADLLGDLKKTEKRAAYLAMASKLYYVLGLNAKGQPIAQPEDIPIECGVMVATGSVIETLRPALPQPFEGLRFDVWMALAKAAPVVREDDSPQRLL
jgi:hypothetical protein